MSHEAWGDNDDGLDDVREAYRQTLLDDGWLDDEDVATLKQWIDDLQSGMFINCVYCGHRYGPADKVQPTMQAALKEHVEQCQKHPMSALKVKLSAASADTERAYIAGWDAGFQEAHEPDTDRDQDRCAVHYKLWRSMLHSGYMDKP